MTRATHASKRCDSVGFLTIYHADLQKMCVQLVALAVGLHCASCCHLRSLVLSTVARMSMLCCTEKQKRGEGHLPSEVSDPTELSGVTLADLIPKSTEEGCKEEQDMQPVVTDLIQAVMRAVNCGCLLMDTHDASNQLENPVSKPDCTLVATGLKAEWTQLVSLWEFNIGTGQADIETMYGQQVERCRHVLDSYDERQLVVAVNITMNTLEVLTAERLPANFMRLSTTGRQPFSISKASPGFQLLVQLLLTPKADLGFVTALMPTIESLGGRRFKVQYLVKQGSAEQGSGSWVFRVKLDADGDAILKLNRAPQEVHKPSVTMHTSVCSTPLACLLCLPSTNMPYCHDLAQFVTPALRTASLRMTLLLLFGGAGGCSVCC